mgnify:CR=1 FL=1
MPRVLVSLVTHNESRDAERLLPSLFAQTFRDFELVAVDNRSEDGTRGSLAAAKKLAPVPMEIVGSPENLGFTGGHNVGIAKAVERGAEWVLVLNADVLLAPDYLAALLADAHRPGHEGVGALTGKILRAEGPGLVPTEVVDTVGIRMTRSGRHFDVGAGEPDTGRWDRPAEIYGVSEDIAVRDGRVLSDKAPGLAMTAVPIVWLAAGEYVINKVEHVEFPNRVLREASLLAVTAIPVLLSMCSTSGREPRLAAMTGGRKRRYPALSRGASEIGRAGRRRCDVFRPEGAPPA